MNIIDPNPNGNSSVLLIHGLGADGSSWFFQTEALKQAGFRPIAIDLPGFGKTPNYLSHWSIENVRDECFTSIQQMGINQFAVIGHSLGGLIALSLAVQYPQSIKKLCLINSFAYLRPVKLDDWIYLLRRFIRTMTISPKAQAELVAKRIFQDDSQQSLRELTVQKIIQTDLVAYRRAMFSIATIDMRQYLSSITMPCLVITSEQDNTVAKQIQQQLAIHIPSARQVIVPLGGHAVIIEQPDLVNQLILEFLLNNPG